MRININADIGESYGRFTVGQDAELMPLIGSANVACGMHAGDPGIMLQTMKLALANGVSIGAHPGFNDIWGFGRRQIKMRAEDLEHLVIYQIGALQALAKVAGATITHVKPHGALNNMAHEREDYAMAIGQAIRSVNPSLIYVANLGSEMSKAGKRLGLRVANEAYVDRLYDDSGLMASRDRADAVIRDPAQAAKQVVSIIKEKALICASGKRIPGEVHSFCIHGDEPTAVPVMTAVRAALAEAGIDAVTLPEMMH